MELILMFVAGAVVLILAVTAIVRGIVYRVKTPIDDIKKQVTNLEQRVEELEKERRT